MWLVDFNEIGNNDWLTVNQFTVIEDRNNRQPNVVIFANGLSIGVIEPKNPRDENATINSAFKQLTRDELRYTLRVDPKDIYGDDFPGETFHVLKEKESKQYGEYRTRRLVLEKWNEMFGEK